MKIHLKDSVSFKELLMKKGYSQRSFGRKIGISEAYACQISNGNRHPGPTVAKDICDCLEVNFDDIFFIENGYKSDQAV